MRNLLISAFVIVLIFFVGCKNTASDNTASNDKQVNNAIITPKLSFYMAYRTSMTDIEAGKEITFHFTPKIKEQESEQVALESGHGKKVNQMIVSDDFSQFYQLWPEYQSDASYASQITIPFGGKYEHILVYKPSSNNGQKVIENIPFVVKGKNYSPQSFKDVKLTDVTEDGYTVMLTVKEGEWKVNSKMKIEGVVKKDNADIDASTFDTYQDGKANMVILKMSDKGYDHSHSDAANGRFTFNHTFKYPGIYRAFLQFKSRDKVYTNDFAFNIKE